MIDARVLARKLHLPPDPSNAWIDFDVTNDPEWDDEDLSNGQPAAWWIEWRALDSNGEAAERTAKGATLNSLARTLTQVIEQADRAPEWPIVARACLGALRFAPPPLLAVVHGELVDVPAVSAATITAAVDYARHLETAVDVEAIA